MCRSRRLERPSRMRRFKIGDKILHPVYGAGTLVSFEERADDGMIVEFYVIELAHGKGRLVTPVEKAKELGLRKPISKRSRGTLSKVFAGRPRKLPEDYRLRRGSINDRLREGSFAEVGGVVRDLTWVEKQGRPTTGDRRLLQRAKDQLAEELAASDDIGQDEAMEQIEAALERRISAREQKSD